MMSNWPKPWPNCPRAQTEIIEGMKGFKHTLFALLALCSLNLQAQVPNAYPGQKTRILFLLDGSGSMLATMGNSNRWAVAVHLMGRVVDTLRTVGDVEVGLRVFGHTQPNEKHDCYDTRLEVPFEPYNHKKFLQRLSMIKPLGYTSITQSLLAAAKDFPEDPTARNIIVIITDGIEECGGDPCAVSEALQKKGIILRPFIVGLGTDSEEFRNAYSCAGRYYNAESPEQFQKVLGVIINQALNNTTVQFNLLDADQRPLETDVPLSLYNADNGRLLDAYVHTMNGKNLPDTLYLDPILRYRVVAHTLPPVSTETVEIIPGRHNTIPLETPQGDLEINIGGINKYGRLQAIVRQHDSMATINAQLANTVERYITGSYDLEILTTPRLYFYNVPVKSNRTYTIELPAPGQLQMTLGRDLVGSVFEWKNNQMVWVMDVEGNMGKTLYAMQPGTYKLVYRFKGETRTLYSKQQFFTIQSGTNTSIAL